jgi:hypothetical protein
MHAPVRDIEAPMSQNLSFFLSYPFIYFSIGISET